MLRVDAMLVVREDCQTEDIVTRKKRQGVPAPCESGRMADPRRGRSWYEAIYIAFVYGTICFTVVIFSCIRPSFGKCNGPIQD